MREHATTEMQKPLPEPPKGPEKPIEITKTVIVTQEKEVVKEQATINNSYIVVTQPEMMIFNEGKQSQYEVTVRVLIPGVKAELTQQGLPAGAEFKPSATDPNRYILTWTPVPNTLQNGEVFKIITGKVSAKIKRS